MKRFLKKLLLFSSPFLMYLLFAFTFETSVRHDDLVDSYSEQIAELEWALELPRVDGIILGSSSLRYGLSSSLLSTQDFQWINFSMDARDPVVSYLILSRYAPELKPEKVLLGLDPWIFAKRYYKNGKDVLYLDLNGRELLNFQRHDRRVVVRKSRRALQRAFGTSGAPSKDRTGDVSVRIPDDYGSVKLDRTAVNFNRVEEDWFEIDRTGWSDLQFLYLEKIADYCRDNEIELTLLVAPKRNDYIHWARDHFRNEHTEWWQRVVKAVPDGRVLGGYPILSGGDQDSIFAEAYHLNSAGQRLYSLYVRENLERAAGIDERFDFLTATTSSEGSSDY